MEVESRGSECIRVAMEDRREKGKEGKGREGRTSSSNRTDEGPLACSP